MTQFLKQHERLILGMALLVVSLFLLNKWIDRSARIADEKNAIAQHELQAQKEHTAQLEKDAQQRDQQYQQTFVLVQQQIQALQNAINNRDAQLVKQREADKVLPLPDLAARWENLIDAPDGIHNVNNQLVVGDAAAHATVDRLEMVPVLQQNLKDDGAIIGQREEQIGKLTDAYSACQLRGGGLQDQMKAQEAACKTQVSDLKAQARKSKRNWFVAGLMSGAAIAARILW